MPRKISFSLKEPDLPEGTPKGALWKTHRLPDETPPAFIKRIYGGWLNHGMTKRQLRVRDSTLVILLNKWLESNPPPEYLAGKLQTLEERYDAFVESFPELTATDLRRLAEAIKRREKRKQNP